MSTNLRNIFNRMTPTEQDIRTLHGIIMALAQGPQRAGARRRARWRAGRAAACSCSPSMARRPSAERADAGARARAAAAPQSDRSRAHVVAGADQRPALRRPRLQAADAGRAAHRRFRVVSAQMRDRAGAGRREEALRRRRATTGALWLEAHSYQGASSSRQPAVEARSAEKCSTRCAEVVAATVQLSVTCAAWRSRRAGSRDRCRPRGNGSRAWRPRRRARHWRNRARRSCSSFFAAATTLSSAASTVVGMRIETCALAISVIDRSDGPTNSTSMPGTAAMASRLSIASLRLDHRQRDDVVVGARADRSFWSGNAGQHRGAMRSPGALADRRKFRGADEALGDRRRC